jgi:hypothetical protein
MVTKPCHNSLRAQLLKELGELLINHLLNLLGDLLGLGDDGLGVLDDLARDDVEVLVNGLLQELNGSWHLGWSRLLLDCVAASLDNGGVVGRSTTVPGEDVLGVRWDIGQGTLGGNGDDVLLQLLGGDGSNGIIRVRRWLERQVVGQETGDVWGGHGGTGDGVGGIWGADPGGKNAQTWGKDVVALSVVGEVSARVIESGGTDSDGKLSSSRGVVARVSIVISSSDGEVDAGRDSTVHSTVEGRRLATTKRHVGSRALEALLSLLDLLGVCVGSPFDTLDNVGHGSRSVGTEDLDSVDIGLLGNTVLLAGNSTRAVSSVSVSVLISIVGGNSLAPVCTALEVDVVDIGSGVNDIDIDTLTRIRGIEVLVEVTEAQALSV